MPDTRVSMSPRSNGYTAAVTETSQVDLREALKRVAVALKQSGLPFALIFAATLSSPSLSMMGW